MRDVHVILNRVVEVELMANGCHGVHLEQYNYKSIPMFTADQLNYVRWNTSIHIASAIGDYKPGFT